MNIDEFVKSSLSKYQSNYQYDITNNKCYITIQHNESLKERDNVLRCFFDELKKRKIYIEDEEEDEFINYLE